MAEQDFEPPYLLIPEFLPFQGIYKKAFFILIWILFRLISYLAHVRTVPDSPEPLLERQP